MNWMGKEGAALIRYPGLPESHVPVQTELEPHDYLLVQEKQLKPHGPTNHLPNLQPR